MTGREGAIEETLRTPERVLESLFDSEARLYYWFYRETTVGAKYLCVVVKITQGDAFVLTAYLTDSVKRGGYGQRQSEGLVRRQGRLSRSALRSAARLLPKDGQRAGHGEGGRGRQCARFLGPEGERHRGGAPRSRALSLSACPGGRKWW